MRIACRTLQHVQAPTLFKRTPPLPCFLAMSAAFAFSITAFASTAALASKDKWFENPTSRVKERAERRREKEARGEISRIEFDDPSDAGRPMFGADAERALERAIVTYTSIVANGGWRPIPKGPMMAPGTSGDRVVLLNRRLIASGDQRRSAARSHKYNDEEVSAVKRFQRRHGLKVTGRVNRLTLQALNISAKHRLAQLKVNLGRVRKIAAQVRGKRYVMINIPAYELQAVSNGRVALYSRVITGKPNTPTPTMKVNVRAVNFFPFWNVPRSIARRAIVPKAAKDPGYLTRERIRVYGSKGELNPASVNWSRASAGNYRFRQDPGPRNALGLIRFDMPNKHIVYMHDTPLQSLFRYGVRSYSAGCVRVNKVAELAAWMLNDNGNWSQNSVRRALGAQKAKTVKLKRQVPVHLVYVTAWGSEDGGANFRLDIYNKDGAPRIVADLEGNAAQISALSP